MQTPRFFLILLYLLFAGCKNPEATNDPAPDLFTATFKTTKGEFDIAVTKAWSPKAADRLYNQIRSGYYDNAVFYRVVPNFVAQFGPADTIVLNKWKNIKVPDEKVVRGNKKGTISFARRGKESRGFDLFINIDDNPDLDTINFEGVKGFPAFGNVTRGMDVVKKLYDGYGERTMEDGSLFSHRKLLLRVYPKLDIIVEANITSEN